MMKFHRPDRRRLIAGGSAVALLAGAGLALGGASAIAQPAPVQTTVHVAKPGEPPMAVGGAVAKPQLVTATVTGARPDGAQPSAKQGSENMVYVVERRKEQEGDAAPKGEKHEMRRFMLKRGPGEQPADKDGRPMHMFGMMEADCDPAERTEINEGDEKARTRIVLCSKGDRTPAERAEHLQRARDRLAKEESPMKPEQRDKVLAALDKEIARLRGQQ